MLKGILQNAKSMSSLCFIEGKEDEHEDLIDNFSIFYFNQLIILKNSKHLFDEEQEIKGIFNEISFFKNIHSKRDFDFIDSSTSEEIQISDVIAYVFGVIFTDILRMTKQDIKALKTDAQVQKNVRLLKELVQKSDQENQSFFQHFLSNDDFENGETWISLMERNKKYIFYPNFTTILFMIQIVIALGCV